jgi:PAS domain S-box-containing protein
MGSEIDFRQLAEVAGDPIVVQDGERISWANQASADIVGAAHPREVIGRPVLDFVPPEFRALVIENMTAVMTTGRPAPPTEQALVRLDGTRVEVEIFGSALGPGRLLLVIRDITGRRRAEAARAGAELQLRAFFETSADAIGLARDGRYVFVNPALARLFGYASPAALVGRPVADVVASAERPKVEDAMRARTVGAPAPTGYLTRGLRSDGAEFELEVRATRVVEADGALVMAILRDVTEPRAAERRVQESERRFRELFEFVPVSLWEVDASAIRAAIERLRAGGVTDLRAHAAAHPELSDELLRLFKVVAVNAFGRALAGASSFEELVARLGEVHTRDALPRLAELGLQIAEGRAIAHAEGWMGTLTGDRIWIETRATVVPGQEADWGRLLFASVDLTTRREAEGERARLQDRLRQAEKLEAVGRLAGGVAHDFNNILSGILGYAELSAIELEPGSDLHDNQQRIREAALRARDLVRQILTFGRRDQASRRVVDVPSVVREAMGLVRTGVPASAALEVRIDPDAGATLADPTQIHQVVLNLCANARDAIGTYGRIEVSLEGVVLAGDATFPAGRYVRLRVRDDGVGMAEETRLHLFEPFLTTKGPIGGHGLGLAVVHGIVTGAGGDVRVESAPGRGSTFDVYFPRRDALEAVPPAPPARTVGRGERILVVDDEPMVRGAHKRLLESLGYVAEVAADGEEALARFREAPDAWALVLTDQSMPRLAGTDLARQILAIRPEARVIVCTGYSDRVDARLARELGLVGLLAKPIERDTLSETLAKALAR